MNFMNSLVSKLSVGEGRSIKSEYELIGNCFGFYGLKPGCGTSTMILELAEIASSRGLQTCIVDCNPLSNFYLTKCIKNLKVGTDMPSINNRFIKHSCPITDCLVGINDYLKVMTFGYTQVSETFNMEMDVVTETYKELKELFDLVLMDIPNIPWVESTLAALNCCSTVYSVLGFDTDSVYTYTKAKNLLLFAGIEHKLNSVIISGAPIGSSMKKSVETVLDNVNVICETPVMEHVKRASLDYLTVLEHLPDKEVREYAKCLEILFKEITTGIENKTIISESDEDKIIENEKVAKEVMDKKESAGKVKGGVLSKFKHKKTKNEEDKL